MSEQHVEVRHEGEIAVVTIQRGGRDNALDESTWEGLRRAALRMSDAPPQVVVLTGTPTFSCGLDLSADNPTVQRLESLSRGRDAYATQEYLRNLRAALTSIGRVPCPVIVAIEGACLGAGFELALNADLRVASREAVLGMPDIAYGLVPMNGGLVHLSRLVGRARAAELVLTGARISAEHALSWGLVNRLTEPGRALEEALELADSLLGHGRQAVLQATLALRQLDGSSDDFLVETQAAARAVTSGDLTEGLLAFLRDRPPSWNSNG